MMNSKKEIEKHRNIEDNIEKNPKEADLDKEILSLNKILELEKNLREKINENGNFMMKVQDMERNELKIKQEMTFISKELEKNKQILNEEKKKNYEIINELEKKIAFLNQENDSLHLKLKQKDNKLKNVF